MPTLFLDADQPFVHSGEYGLDLGGKGFCFGFGYNHLHGLADFQ